MPTAHEWLAAYAEKLGAPKLSDAEIDAILDLAGVAAHASERKAAPLTCWIAARAGVSIEDARKAADELAG
jgi:hypothetical protein